MSSFSRTRRAALKVAGLGILAPQTWAQTPSLGNKDLVVLIPGIMGSELSLRGKSVWAPSLSGVTGALVSLGKNLDGLQLKNDPYDQLELDDGVVATRVVRDVHLIPGLWKIDGYTKLIEQISSIPGIQPGQNFFEFPYDWRRDNRASAKRLQIATEAWLTKWRQVSGNADAKVVFVAHSMGGLIARYYIECLQGWRNCRRLIAIGTPFRGSLNALKFLHADSSSTLQRLGLVDLPALVRSFTSVYQLLPAYPCVREGDALKRIAETDGIANLDIKRVVDALSFYRRIDAAVTENQKTDDYRRSRYKIHPIVGVWQDTLQSAQKNGSALTITNGKSNSSGQSFDGDGTVPRPSATPLELQGGDTELYVAEVHGSLQNSSTVLTQLRGLLSVGATEWSAFRASGTARASLRVEDAFSTADEVSVSGVLDPSDYEKELEVNLTEADSHKLLKRSTVRISDSGTFRVTFPPQAEGTYRVQVRYTRKIALEVKSLSDVTCVLRNV